MAEIRPIYRLPPAVGTALRQGEILSNLRRAHLNVEQIKLGAFVVDFTTHQFAVILSQDCDLDQDFSARHGSKKLDKLIPAVLLAEVSTASELKADADLNSGLWGKVKTNNDVRFHFLEKVQLETDSRREGMPELAIDFKRYFTVPTDELYYRVEIGEAVRRTHFHHPYLEHLSTRFASYLQRVALPSDHASE